MILIALLCLANTLRTTLRDTDAIYDWIYKSQHPIDCSQKSWVTPTRRTGAGIGSEISTSAGILGWAVDQDAIFIWGWSQWMTSAWCATEKTFACVFVPPTNCTRSSLNPRRQLHPRGFFADWYAPTLFRNKTEAPFKAVYTWQAHAYNYLARVNDRYAEMLQQFTDRLMPPRIPCGSVCVYVRHGDKGTEMELLPWRKFRTAIATAHQIATLTFLATDCIDKDFAVFLMTDDASVVSDAKRDLGAQILHVQGTTSNHTLHPGVRPSTADEKLTTFNIMMLNIHLCLQCDGFVSQRGANFARWIDFLRLTRYRKAYAPFIEAGEYTFEIKS